jgi:formimidoylglutamate deiminase
MRCVGLSFTVKALSTRVRFGMGMASRLHLEKALAPDGWRTDLVATIEGGTITALEPATDRDGIAERVGGVVLPGMPNLHSHAFQRAMAGLTESRGIEADSFWSWRETMYRFVERLQPDDLEAIAAFAYMEMLEAGFTSVAEFHYLHHQPDGRPYDNPAEMSERIVAAADAAGIGLTLLPVLYRQGGFSSKPPTAGQRRFLNGRDSYAHLMETRVPGGNIGIAPHSLRAVTLEDLRWAAATWRDQPAHIHISEQTREVEECVTAHGQRPIDLLLDTVDVGERWCLVHGTHADSTERARLARSRAVVGLCPITEANLGDGLFDVPDFLSRGGRLGIGSDSLVRISVADELRTLEYGQRLARRQRNVLGEPARSTGRRLFELALSGGAQATGRPIGTLAAGKRADFVALDSNHPSFAAVHDDAVIDAFVFAADNAAITTVYSGGVPVVREGRHIARDTIAARYRKTVSRLSAL